jgi:SAM-dependent methyltransferase
MGSLSQKHHIGGVENSLAAADAARVYNQAADGYLAYADGDTEHLFSFEGHHAYADRYVWSVLDTKLRELRRSGATSITILDAGCGPGTWTRRLVTRAGMLGFSVIRARGFDVAQVQVAAAWRNAQQLKSISGLDLAFEVADLEERMPEGDASVDIAVCLYSVLSHLPLTSLPPVVSELARVTRGSFITTVRAIGSTPTVFVGSLDGARRFERDHDSDQCDIEFADERHLALRFHLFTAAELQRQFASHFEIEDLCGLDLFHGRFSPDPRWNPLPVRFDPRLANLLAWLEERYARNPSIMDRATQSYVGRPPKTHLS